MAIGLLQQYQHSLRNYQSHPEAKFLNAERGERGPTRRRHIVAKSIRFIGKEANRLDEQLAFGSDPDAQSEFGIVTDSYNQRVSEVRNAAGKYGISALARAALVSRQYLSEIINGDAMASENMLSKIEQAVAGMMTEEQTRAHEAASTLKWLQRHRDNDGLRKLAKSIGIEPGYLSRVLSGKRPMRERLVREFRHRAKAEIDNDGLS